MNISQNNKFLTYYHCWNRDASDESYSHRGSYDSSQLPHQLLLPAPGLLAPEGAAGGGQVVKVGYLLHAQPAELAGADTAGHVVAGPVVHLDNQHATARADLDVQVASHPAVLTTAPYGMSLCSGLVTRDVGMPVRLAVVTEAVVAAGPHTVKLGTGGAAGSNDSVTAIGSGTPPGVRVSSQHPPHHQELVEVE